MQLRDHARTIIYIGLIVGLVLSGLIFLWIGTFKMPDLEAFDQRKVEQSTKIYDRTGEVLLYDAHESVKRTVVPYDHISTYMKNATVAIEDAEFWQHNGIKPTAIIRASIANLLSQEFAQGGSTITQQVVKNALLTTDKTIPRKIKEWVLALRLEKQLPKEKILEIYLNEVPFGGVYYGAEEASQAYFGKPAANLSLAEAAYLAAMLRAPTYYSPYGNHPDKLAERKHLVLRRMLENGFITDSEYESARSEEVAFKPRSETGIKAPHFVFYVLDELTQKYGERAIEERGFKVITTLDYELEDKAEDIVYKYALENETKFNARNAGLVALDPTTGQILVMVGSRDYFDPSVDGNFNIALAKRQPGSAFKPIVYATAFMKGYTPETVVFDVPTQFAPACAADNPTSETPCYAPQNYDSKFRGPMTLRNALAQSVNVPAVKVLYLTGLKDALSTARAMGIETLTTADRYGLTLVLGGGEVTLLDLTSSYGVFATEGVRHIPAAILRVEDSSGNVIETFEDGARQVLPAEAAQKISSILSDNVARTPLYGPNSLLYFGEHDVAVKTGTTNDYRDVWTVGYTPFLAVGAWAGNNDNSPMDHQLSGLIITPLWRAFMDEALKKYPDEPFRDPPYEELSDLKPILRGIWQGGETYVIDKLSGKLATEYTPEETREERVVYNVHSILYWVDKDNPRGAIPARPESDPQFTNWEYGVLAWKQENNIRDGSAEEIPKQSDTLHKPGLIDVAIISPEPGAILDGRKSVAVTLEAASANKLTKAEYYVDGVLMGSSNPPSFSFSFTPKDLSLSSGTHRLKVMLYDRVSNTGEYSVSFIVD